VPFAVYGRVIMQCKHKFTYFAPVYKTMTEDEIIEFVDKCKDEFGDALIDAINDIKVSRRVPRYPK
jgi:hypothetical protein